MMHNTIVAITGPIRRTDHTYDVFVYMENFEFFNYVFSSEEQASQFIWDTIDELQGEDAQ